MGLSDAKMQVQGLRLGRKQEEQEATGLESLEIL
jgi:hypothetical protein